MWEPTEYELVGVTWGCAARRCRGTSCGAWTLLNYSGFRHFLLSKVPVHMQSEPLTGRERVAIIAAFAVAILLVLDCTILDLRALCVGCSLTN